MGRTTWSTWDARIGFAWHWTEIMKGVFALSDPMTIESNLRLVNGSGVEIADSLSIVQLNVIVHSVPWQAEVKATAWHRADTHAMAR